MEISKGHRHIQILELCLGRFASVEGDDMGYGKSG